MKTLIVIILILWCLPASADFTARVRELEIEMEVLEAKTDKNIRIIKEKEKENQDFYINYKVKEGIIKELQTIDLQAEVRAREEKKKEEVKKE